MENLNKKRPEVNNNGDNKTSVKKMRTIQEHSNGELTAKDAEFEEFLAILDRLKAGFDHFKNKGVKDCVLAKESGSTNTGFELEDFMQFHDGRQKAGGGDVIRNETVFRFDLNADPTCDQMAD